MRRQGHKFLDSYDHSIIIESTEPRKTLQSKMEGGTLRYDHNPVLQSVLAFGSETQVPDHDICRLSYYVKCCVVGCGIRIPLADDALLDYMTAHTLPLHMQELLKRMAFQELSLDKLLNSALIVDEQHILLPFGTLNTFFEFKTASTYFTINSLSIGSGRQECVHKVMLCTMKWLQEYYINPLSRYLQGNPLLTTLNGNISFDLLQALNLLSIQLNFALLQQSLLPPNQHLQLPQQVLSVSLPLNRQQNQQQGAPSTPDATSSAAITIPEASQVQELTDQDAMIPDAPLAVAELVVEDSDVADSSLVEVPARVIQ